jgi:hypothetical protein
MNVHQFRRPPQQQRKRPVNHDLVAWAALLVGAVASVAWRLFFAGSGGTLVGLLAAIAVWMAFGGGGGSRGPLRRMY